MNVEPSTAFARLLDICLDLDEQWRNHDQPGGYKLGVIDEAHNRITLFNVEYSEANLKNLQDELNKAGVSYQMQPVNVFMDSCNVLIDHIE